MQALNICALGDPTKRKTWSGTPYNIYTELTKRRLCGQAFDARVSGPWERVLAGISSMLYGKIDTGRAPLRRYARALHVKAKTKQAPSPYTLHMGTLSLPFPKGPASQKHYLLCDSTWNLWSRYATDLPRYSDRTHAMYDKLERTSYAQMHHIFSISEYVKQNLVEHYGVPAEKITVVGTGLGAIQPFQGRKVYESKKILFTAKGRFRDKGGHLVIKAFERALATDPNLKLTIVGSEEARVYATHPSIEVHGFVSLEALQAMFDTHALFLMPAYNEPWGLVYLEAMACKMPVMGLNRNSFPELSGHGQYGFIINQPDPVQIAYTLIEAFQRPSILHLMGEQAQAFCLEHYSWENTVSRMLDVIKPEPIYA